MKKLIFICLCFFVIVACSRPSGDSGAKDPKPRDPVSEETPETQTPAGDGTAEPLATTPVHEGIPETQTPAEPALPDSSQGSESAISLAGQPLVTVPLEPSPVASASLVAESDKSSPAVQQSEGLVAMEQGAGSVSAGAVIFPAEPVLSPSVLPTTLPSNTGINDRKPCEGRVQELLKHPYCQVPDWLAKATVREETVLITEEGKVIWKDGVWGFGTWRGHIWKNGWWKGGTFYGGVWENGTWEIGDWRGHIWYNGTWIKGEWQTGIWKQGVWKNGTFRRGIWTEGVWEFGGMHYSIWENGQFLGGGFTRSVWHTGIFKAEYWIDSLWKYGEFDGGESAHFYSGTWENGIFLSGHFSGWWKNGIFRGGIWYGDNDNIWDCGIFYEDTAQWGWPAWMAEQERVNSPDCDLSLAGQPPAFLTEERVYTFVPEQQIYRCADCLEPKKIYAVKPGCRGSIKELSYKPECALPEWLKQAKTTAETVAMAQDNTVIWEDGVWHRGVWKGGIWKHGRFARGIWEKGIWENGIWGDHIIRGFAQGDLLWVTGTWKGGLFKEGLWIGGAWRGGYHIGGLWGGGQWLGGLWEGGIWHRGKPSPEELKEGFWNTLWEGLWELIDLYERPLEYTLNEYIVEEEWWLDDRYILKDMLIEEFKKDPQWMVQVPELRKAVEKRIQVEEAKKRKAIHQLDNHYSH